MKALAAVSIRQYFKVVTSLKTYDKTLEMRLHILLKRDLAWGQTMLNARQGKLLNWSTCDKMNEAF